MVLPDFLTRNPDGIICLTGHRIRLIDVAARYEEGHSAEGIVVDYYPTLDLSLVHKVIAFYLENEAEVRGMVAEHERKLAELAAKPRRPTPTLAELRQRMKARRRAEAS